MSRPADPGEAREHTRSGIVTVLRRSAATIDQLAAELGVTKNAVRGQLAALERDGLVSRRGVQRGRTKPSHVYELTPEGELRLSRLYIPLLTQLLHVLAARLPPDQFDDVMRQVGRGLLRGRPLPNGPFRERVRAASDLFNEFGGLTYVEEHPHSLLIRSHGCPLAATAARHPETCHAVESLFSEFTGSPVVNCCEREERLRCCFEVFPPDAAPAPRPEAAT